MNIERLLDSPHLLIAGTTGSGKSVLLNKLMKILEGRYVLFDIFDLKRVELREYKNSEATGMYITEPEDVCDELDVMIMAMDRRYKEMDGKQYDGCPLYIVIDELADMLTVKGVLERLVKIGRLGRAANIHLLCCTQDPSKHTLSAQLMQNFTTRVALRCFSDVESRQIIGVPGAEQLPKHGYGIVRDADGIQKFAIPL